MHGSKRASNNRAVRLRSHRASCDRSERRRLFYLDKSAFSLSLSLEAAGLSAADESPPIWRDRYRRAGNQSWDPDSRASEGERERKRDSCSLRCDGRALQLPLSRFEDPPISSAGPTRPQRGYAARECSRGLVPACRAIIKSRFIGRETLKKSREWRGLRLYIGSRVYECERRNSASS